MKYDFDLLIKRTRRKKTLSIIIRDQKVILSAPKYVSDQEIDKILESKFNLSDERIKDLLGMIEML